MLSKSDWEEYYSCKKDQSKWSQQYWLPKFRSKISKPNLSANLTFAERLMLKRHKQVDQFLDHCFLNRGCDSYAIFLSYKKILLYHLGDEKLICYIDLFEAPPEVAHAFRKAKCIPIEVLDEKVDEDGITLCKVKTYSFKTKEEEVKIPSLLP